MKKIFILLCFGSLVFALTRCQDESQPSDHGTNEPNDFVGEKQCVSCHAAAYEKWTGSHHDWAMKLADETSVLGDFNNSEVRLDGVDYAFFKEGSEFKVRIREINGDVQTYSIEYTFGFRPLQQYLVEFDNGKYQVLRVSWDSESNNWFHQYAGQSIKQNDWLHWTGGGQRWNTMCAECHSTNLKRNYNAREDAFQTTWSSINVGCESCHGPGKHHVDWANSGKPEGAPYIVSGRNQKAQISQCGPCHARRSKMTGDFQVGVPFDQQYILQDISPPFYHGDGQILEEDYVLSSFEQSKMYRKGVKCGDCHDPHGLGLKLQGNALCLQCHEPKYDQPVHHKHVQNTEASLCVSCHMTGKTYMGNDFRRDHSFRIPRPDQSVHYGTPNACENCHSEKGNQWAADQINQWYGKERKAHFSDPLLLCSEVRALTEEERKDVLNFIRNITEPAIARVSAIEQFDFNYDKEELDLLIRLMEDSSALVRYQAIMQFMDFPEPDRYNIAFNHLTDTSRMVRIAAAQLSMDADMNEIPAEIVNDFNRAMNDYREMLQSNADFPLGRLHFGDYYFRTGNLEKAVEEYKMALEMDSLLTVVYPNLANALSNLGRNEEVMQVLNDLIRIEPGYARAYYLRALLFHELQNEMAAQKDFEKSLELDPTYFRTYYNLALLHHQQGHYVEAEKVILEGLKTYPESPDGLQVLALIYKSQGKQSLANEIYQKLNAGVGR